MSTISTQNAVFLILSIFGPCSSASTSNKAEAPSASAGLEATLRTPEPHTHGTVVDSASPSAGATKTTYVCPMHADVVMDAPGLCPKCNMKLEPKPLTKASDSARAASTTSSRTR